MNLEECKVIHTGLYSNVAFNLLKSASDYYVESSTPQARRNFIVFSVVRASDNEVILSRNYSSGRCFYNTRMYKAKDEREFKVWLAFQVKAYAMRFIKLAALCDKTVKWSRHCNVVIRRDKTYDDMHAWNKVLADYVKLDESKLVLGTVAQIYAVYDFLQHRTKGINKALVEEVVGVQLDPIAEQLAIHKRNAIEAREQKLKKDRSAIYDRHIAKLEAVKKALAVWRDNELAKLRAQAVADIEAINNEFALG